MESVILRSLEGKGLMRILYLRKENVTCGHSRWSDGLYSSPNITGEIGSGI